MKIVIKNILGNDYCSPGEVWKDEDGKIVKKGPELPENPENCSVWVSIDIGPDDEEGENIFQFNFVTPQYLQEKIIKDGTQLGRHMIIIKEFSWEIITPEMERIFNLINEGDFSRFAEKLGRYGKWEYEDYTVS